MKPKHLDFTRALGVLLVLLTTYLNVEGARRRSRDSDTCQLHIQCPDDLMGPNETHVPVKLPIRGPRGHKGESGPRGPTGDPGEPGIPGMPGRSAPMPQNVAFFAGLQKNMATPIKKDTDIVFASAVTNVGGAYDTETGKFTAPFNGTYQFTLTIAAMGNHAGAGRLLKNNEMVFVVWAESIPRWSTASNSALLQLRKGDVVSAQAVQRAPYIHGYMYSTFSGFLTFNEEPQPNPGRH